MFRSHPKTAVQNSQRRCRPRGVWGLLIIFVASQSPIPVFHYHGDPQSEDLHSSSLASHLRTCHDSTCRHCADEPLGWHCHFMLPGMMSEVPLGEDDPGQSDPVTPLLVAKVSIEAGPTDSLNPIACLPDVLSAADEHCPLMGRDDALKCRHFLDGFADRLSLPERLSISRC